MLILAEHLVRLNSDVSTVRWWMAHFSNYTIVEAVKQWVTSTGTDFYWCSIQVLLHLFQKIIAKGGSYVKKIAFYR